MAATKTVTKKTNKDAIVRIVATAANDTSTIDLQTDLKLTNETLGAAQKVYISAAYFSTAANVSLTRNSVVVANYFGGGDHIDAEWVLTDQETHDIVVTFGGAGMILLHLKKIDGYNDPIETAAFGIYDDETVVGS
jgi:hypothetical protein